MDGQPSSKRPSVGSSPTGGSVVSGRGSAWQERLSGGQEIAGSNPAAPTNIHASLARPGGGGFSSPSARWPRRPDPHSGDAGSNPAGDTGPTCRPARFRREARAPAAEPTNHPLPVLAARHRATNAAVEVQLLAGRPCPRPGGSPGAGLRCLTIRVRLPAGAPQGGTVPREVHGLAPVGAIPTPASATTRGERRLS